MSKGFINFGGDVPVSSGNFVKLEEGESINLVLLTGLKPPDGEAGNGKNCFISYDEYSIWIEQDKLPEGVATSPRFPKIGNNPSNDPGTALGLTARFKAMALVVDTAEKETTKILPMTVTTYRKFIELEQTVEEVHGRGLQGAVVRFTRTGKGLKTTYSATFTGKFVDVSSREIDLDLVDFVGPTTQEEQIEMLKKCGLWKDANKKNEEPEDDFDDIDF